MHWDERKLFNPLISYIISVMNMEEKEQKEHIDIQKETLKPITKTKSKEDKELKEQEVESVNSSFYSIKGYSVIRYLSISK
jgi:hypothetical protein